MPKPSLSSPVDAIAFAAARKNIRATHPGFFYAALLLPKPKRAAACAIHAFCHMIANAIDSADPAHHSTCSASEVDERLAMIHDRLDAIYAGQVPPPTPHTPDESAILFAAMRTILRYDIPKDFFLDFAQGKRADLRKKRYATWNALAAHCHNSAGLPALILCAILGVSNSGASENAVQLGQAIRLTSILRDIKTDLSAGRIYLPLEDLARFKYSERDLAAGLVNDHFRELMKFQIARARQLFTQGADGLCWLGDDGSRLAVSAIALVHSGILKAIERIDYDVLHRTPKLDAGQQLRRLSRAWRLARRNPDQPLPDVFR